MTQDVAIAILPRIGRIGVPRHFFISTTDLSDRTDKCPVGGWEQDKNQEKPLGEDGGRCPDVMLPPWSYKSELLTPKPKAYHHLPYRRSPSSPRR